MDSLSVMILDWPVGIQLGDVFEANDYPMLSRQDGGVCWSGFWCACHLDFERDLVLGHVIFGQGVQGHLSKNAVRGWYGLRSKAV